MQALGDMHIHDLEKWARQQLFHFHSRMAGPSAGEGPDASLLFSLDRKAPCLYN